ncbi:MAG: thioredoxin family protein [Clostridia bacterium]|nr:thioredoxin family protein [Clostridia bacterium]
MKIITLGNCCSKSRKNHENAVEAAKNCGVDAPENVADYSEIVRFGVMSTPALVIDGKVVAYGRALSVEQIEKLINENK